jgi:hypothetical protein
MHAPRFVPKLHSFLVSFVGNALGFGLAVVALGGVDGSPAGTLAAAAISAGSGLVIDLGVSGQRHDVLWMVASLLWLVVDPLIASYLAPGYSVHGAEALLGLIVLVTASGLIVGRASPWRSRWSP